jgi:spermidine/putrescine transport system substrate-binding protein
MIKKCIFILLSSLMSLSYGESILRVAGWGGEIPNEVFKTFEKKHHIKVYFSSFESNESLDVKLRTSKKCIYDLILPSSYYIPRLIQSDLLQTLKLENIPAEKLINPVFKPETIDNQYSIPLNWSSTAIFYNKKYFQNPPQHWQDLWGPEFKNQVLLLDDTREVFSIALISLGYSPNDETPQHIQKAYSKLLQLRSNIKLFGSDAVPNLMIDEDALIGMAWSADIIKAQTENSNIGFVLPNEGFIINTESFAIPKNAENVNAAYAFINFMLTPENLLLMASKNHFPPTIQAKYLKLPIDLKDNPILFPHEKILKSAILQKNVSQITLQQYNQLWEMFKLSL